MAASATLIFDLNGTLTDAAAIGRPWGLPDFGDRVLARAVQTAMVDAILGFWREFAEHLESALRGEVTRRSLDPSRIPAALEQTRRLPPFADVEAGLQQLAEAGYTLAVLTNSGARSGTQTLEAAGLAGYFARILGVDAVRSFKPHPETYAHALRELAVPAREVTFVAAHFWDLAGAKHAGCRTALLTRGTETAPAVFPTPDLVAADLPDLVAGLET
jgi:2-haloacid dehalogenase